MRDRNDGILSGPIDLDRRPSTKPTYPKVPARLGTVVEHRSSGATGSLVRFSPHRVVLRDAHGRERELRVQPGAFCVDGRPVELVECRTPTAVARPARSASGSVALADVPARVARPSRIFVEGLHDAELIEHVWGDDLRIEGVVVEVMDGADDLETIVRVFGPRPGRRLGVLLDHLVDGTKESRLAQRIDHPDVLIAGHPFVDVWQAIKPSRVGLAAWPDIAPSQPWKEGIATALGFAGTSGELWKQLRARVRSYLDLEPVLVGAVESLIDFVTAEPHQ